MKYIILLGVMLFVCQASFAQQDRFVSIEKKLQELETEVPGLKGKVELSVSSVSIQEFVRGIASVHNLNVSIDPNLKIIVVNNFSNAEVSDVLMFLCKQYDLDITFIGTIMSINKYIAPPTPAVVQQRKNLKINYDGKTDFLSLDLKKDTLSEVVKEITRISMRNVILAPGIENDQVSVFIQNRPFGNALDKLAFANNLKLTATDDNFFLLEKNTDAALTSGGKDSKSTNNSKSGKSGVEKVQGLDIKISPESLITVSATDVPITDILYSVSKEMTKNYFLFSEPKGNTTLYVENATYDDFLSYLFNGTEHSYKIDQENVYLIGPRKLEGLRETKTIQLVNRTVESVLDIIPTELKKDVEIKEFMELNSLVASGSSLQIHEIEKFIRQVDIVVPVVMIDVIIVNLNKSKALKTGLRLGVGESPSETAGTGSLFPGVSFDVSTNAVNELLGLFNGYGLVNLGKVTPNFYMGIDALETEGVLDKKSTPKLATLNGHEAKLSIGETDYYAETSNNIIGTQNPTVTNSIVYKPLQADLEVIIKPMVSGDDQVTLDITVNQSNFKEKGAPNAPRGTVSIGFESLVRMKNGETIMLGGLEVKSTDNNGSGLPLLSRIPVLKWIFSNREYKKQNDKLHIFIKPTLLY